MEFKISMKGYNLKTAKMYMNKTVLVLSDELQLTIMNPEGYYFTGINREGEYIILKYSSLDSKKKK